MAKAPARKAKAKVSASTSGRAKAVKAVKSRPSKRAKAARTRSLKEYQAKRNFGVSPEPAGDKTSGAKTPRAARGKAKVKGSTFVVQKHLASHLHYDFRLEHGGTLVSWAVPKGPSLNPRDKRLAMRVEDHPLDYADFEGVIPEGYGAGIVMVWDAGTWTPEPGFEDVDAALKDGELKFRLEGVKLKGSWVLVRTGGGRADAAGESRTWLLIKHRDDWAGEVDVLTAAPKSVKSFGDFEDILAGKEPAVWESHRPAKGGAAGKMLAEVIERAAKKKVGKGKRKP
ncbi:MAG TPA: DNA polymerase ligase N-terminal domain-containing protein [Tepidisphaeraceae bacterium]|nr:DNA polymerase ligase N-terminal domain-containing protein [Tepidisphaeraceae bacterium]